MRPIKDSASSGLGCAWRPGLITGAADDDPSGIATYSPGRRAVRLRPGLDRCSTLPAHGGDPDGQRPHRLRHRRGPRRQYHGALPRPVLYGWSACCSSPTPSTSPPTSPRWARRCACSSAGSAHLYAVAFGVALPGAAGRSCPIRATSGYLKWLTLVLLAYVAVPVHASTCRGAQRAAATLVPAAVAATATYCDDRRRLRHHDQPLSVLLAGRRRRSRTSRRRRARRMLRMPTQGATASAPHPHRYLVGMGFSNLDRLLHHRHDGGDAARARHHAHRHAAQAAEALRPIAGDFAFALFAAGIIGTGLLAVPVLAGLGRLCRGRDLRLKRGSLELPASGAIGFYAIISARDAGRRGLTSTSIDPITMLFWTAVINGVVAVPIMAAMMLTVSGEMRHRLHVPSWLLFLRLARDSADGFGRGGLWHCFADGLSAMHGAAARASASSSVNTQLSQEAHALRRFEREARAAARHDIDYELGVLPIVELVGIHIDIAAADHTRCTSLPPTRNSPSG